MKTMLTVKTENVKGSGGGETHPEIKKKPNYLRRIEVIPRRLREEAGTGRPQKTKNNQNVSIKKRGKTIALVRNSRGNKPDP